MAQKAFELAKLALAKIRQKPWLVVFAATFAVFLAVGLSGTGGKDLAYENSAGSTATASIESAPATPSPVQAQFFIHLAGEIKKPGVYLLPAGSRLFEAIALAGGFSARADQSSVNLVRPIMDGEQILVLGKTVGVTNGVTGGASSLTGPIGAGGRSAKINLNQATVAQLDTLPGIGPAIAQRIVDWRTANGPFRSLSDLTKISGIGEKLVSGIRDAVVLP